MPSKLDSRSTLTDPVDAFVRTRRGGAVVREDPGTHPAAQPASGCHRVLLLRVLLAIRGFAAHRLRMARPCCPRRIATLPGVVFFKPAGIPLRELEERVLTLDEFEALRLADVDGLPQLEAARLMGISRQTFSRILARARGTVATCLTTGTAVRIEGGVVNLVAAPKPRPAKTGKSVAAK